MDLCDWSPFEPGPSRSTNLTLLSGCHSCPVGNGYKAGSIAFFVYILNMASGPLPSQGRFPSKEQVQRVKLGMILRL
jgi:hypothetical protein